MSEFTQKEPCPSCGSRDNLARYSDGHAHCFGCGHYEHGDGSKSITATKMSELSNGDFIYAPITKRKISQQTCEKYKYMVGLYKGQPVHNAVHVDAAGKIVAHKYRFDPKDFLWQGDSSRAVMFGSHLFAPNPNISLTITEGHLDALSIAEIQNCKWPVISLNGGVQQAKKEFKDNFDYLSGFKELRLCFDNDEHGKKAIEDVMLLFKPGYVKVVILPLKDASDMLLAGKVAELSLALATPKIWRPDHVVNSKDLNWEELMQPVAKGWDLPYPYLNEMVRGVLPRRLYLLSAGYGAGKSTMMKEIALSLRIKYDLKIASIHLEEGLHETVLSYICMDNDIPTSAALENPSIIGLDNIEKSKEKLYSTGKFSFYKHFGADDVDRLIAKIDYFASADECDIVIFDHITAAVSGIRGGQEGDRKTLDYLLDSLRSLIQRTGVTVIAAAQLIKSSGNSKGPNDGGQISISDLRGSGQMAGVPDVIWVLEGDQGGEDPNDRVIRVLKNRITGKVGLADHLTYKYETGRLSVIDKVDMSKPSTDENF